MSDTNQVAKNHDLPTNIEQATPDYIRENLEKWDENILKSRAARLQISEAEAARVDDKPLFLIHAEERATAEGVPVETLLERYAREFSNSKYPTRECFLPDEVQEFVQHGPLPTDRIAHIDTCSACSMLLASSLPRAIDGILALQNSRLSNRQEQKSVTVRLTAIALPVLLLLFCYGAFWLFDKHSALQTVLSDSRTWLIALSGTFLYIAAARGLAAYHTSRSWVTASVVGLVLVGFTYVNIQQIRAATAADVLIAFKRAQDRTESLALRAIQQHQTTGQFPDVKEASAFIGSKTLAVADLSVKTANLKQAATYTLKPSDLRGEIVAEVGPEQGEIKWEDGNKVLSEVRLRTVTVETVASNDTPPTVTFVGDGSSHKLLNLDGLPLLQKGTRVVAAIDPSDSSVQNFAVLSKNLPH